MKVPFKFDDVLSTDFGMTALVIYGLQNTWTMSTTYYGLISKQSNHILYRSALLLRMQYVSNEIIVKVQHFGVLWTVC